MPNAQSDRVTLRYGREVTWGTVPAVAGNGLLILSDSLSPDYQTEESQSVRGDGQVPNIVRVGQGANGGIPFEMQYGQFDDLIAGALRNEWTVDTPASGTDRNENDNDLISYTLEKEFGDLPQFATYTGMRVGTLSLNFAPKARLTGEISFQGKSPTWGVATQFTGTPVEALDNPMMVTSSGITLTIDGVAFEIATEFSIEIDNELRMQDAIGAVDPIGIGLGLFRLTGSLAAYFPDRNLVDRIVGDTFFPIVADITDSAGNAYQITIPSAKLMTESGVGNSGRSTDVIQSFTWAARRDPTTEVTLRIDRTPV